MADGKIEIGVELDASGAKSEAASVGRAAGKEFSDGMEKGASGASSAIESETAKTKGTAKADGAAAGKAYGDEFVSSATSAMSSFAKGAAGVLGVGTLINGAFTSAEVANEFQEDMGKLTVAFEQAGYSAETTSAVYQDFVGILGETDQSVEAANHLAGLGLTQEELAQYTDIAAGAYATFSDSLPLESLTEAIAQTSEVGTAQGTLVDALTRGGIAEEEFNAALAECSNEQERAALITATLNDLYGEAGQMYQDVNGDVIAYRESQSNLTAAVSETGRALMPLITGLKNLAAGALSVLATILPPIIGFFERWWPVLLGVTVATIAYFTALNMGTIISTVTTLLTTLKTAVLAVNTAMAANPILLVVSLIAGIIAAIVAFIATNEEARAKIAEIWGAIKETAADVWGAIVTFFTETIPNAIQSLVDWFTTLDDRIKEAFLNILAKAASFVVSFAQNALDAGRQFASNILNTIASLPSSVVSIGRNIVSGIWNGISSGFDWIMGKIRGWCGNLLDGIANLLGIHSPSTVFRDEIGVNISKGIAVGFEKDDSIGQIQASITRSMASLNVAASAQFSGAGNTVNHFTIERIDAHDMQGINNVEALINLFNRNAYA